MIKAVSCRGKERKMLVKKKPQGHYSGSPGRFYPGGSRFDSPDIFDRWLRDYRDDSAGYHWHPAVDIIDRDKHLLVRVDIPGIDEKDIEISFDGHILSIAGERKDGTGTKDEEYLTSEIFYGKFHRVIHLPSSVDSRGIKARYGNGVLEITVPRKKESKKKPVKVGAKK